MKIFIKALVFVLAVAFALGLASLIRATGTAVSLGTAASFAVLGGSTVTNSGPTVVNGDLGLSPGTSVTGFTFSSPPGLGTVVLPGTTHITDGPAGLAQTAATAAYTALAHETCDFGPFGPTDLAGQTLIPGVYCYSSSVEISSGGVLTLDAQGDPNAVWVFEVGSTLTTVSGASVVFINPGVGTPGCNVFWQVGSSATLGTTTAFVGTIIADHDITLTTSATVKGRVLALGVSDDGAVTLATNTITPVVCASTPTPTPTPTATPSPTPTATPTLTPTPTPTSSPTASSAASSLSASGVESVFCPALNIQIVSPTILKSRRVSPTSIFVGWGPYSGVNTFNVQYGPTDGNWLYSTDVTGFSTTINSLSVNDPIWVRVGARSDCTIGIYGQSKLVGGPDLPSTGFAPGKNNILWYLAAVIFVGIMVLTVLIERKYIADNVTFK